MSVLCIACLTNAAVSQIPNPSYTISVTGPCDLVIEGLPGSQLDDGTFGEPWFKSSRPGINFEVVLTKRNSPVEDQQRGMTTGWSWALGVEGPALITDVSLEGTITCYRWIAPECLMGAGFSQATELTGVPWGTGPYTEENHGAVSSVIVIGDDSSLPGDGEWAIGRTRVTATFPETRGDTVTIGVVFGDRIGGIADKTTQMAIYRGLSITETMGMPPLELRECRLTLVAVDSLKFIRCDTNRDGDVNISDPVWLLNELFHGGPPSPCAIARDCNNDGEVNITDAIYALLYLFGGGPTPALPFPECGSVDGMTSDDCLSSHC
jgi:hypothetical protein